MKPKFLTILGGTLLYLVLFILISLLFGLLLLLLLYPYILTLQISILFGIAFLFKNKGWASAIHLILALPIFYLIGSGLFFFEFNEYGITVYLILAGVVAIIGLIGIAGILTARWSAAKWPSPKARRISIRLALSLPLITYSGLFLFDQVHVVYSGWQAGKASVPALKCNASELETSQVVPALDAPVTQGTNLIWCAPFQLAWNEMTELIGEEIHLAKNEPRYVPILNQHSVGKEHLDPETYVAAAGPYTRDFVAQMNAEIKAQFGAGAFKPEPLTHAGGQKRLAAFG